MKSFHQSHIISSSGQCMITTWLIIDANSSTIFMSMKQVHDCTQESMSVQWFSMDMIIAPSSSHTHTCIPSSLHTHNMHTHSKLKHIIAHENLYQYKHKENVLTNSAAMMYKLCQRIGRKWDRCKFFWTVVFLCYLGLSFCPHTSHCTSKSETSCSGPVSI